MQCSVKMESQRERAAGDRSDASPRAQIKHQQPRQSHGEIGIAVRIDSDSFKSVDPLLPHGALNGHTGLSRPQHNGLIIDNAPSIPHVLILSHAIDTPPRIDAGVPQVA